MGDLACELIKNATHGRFGLEPGIRCHERSRPRHQQIRNLSRLDLQINGLLLFCSGKCSRLRNGVGIEQVHAVGNAQRRFDCRRGGIGTQARVGVEIALNQGGQWIDHRRIGGRTQFDLKVQSGRNVFAAAGPNLRRLLHQIGGELVMTGRVSGGRGQHPPLCVQQFDGSTRNVSVRDDADGVQRHVGGNCPRACTTKRQAEPPQHRPAQHQARHLRETHAIQNGRGFAQCPLLRFPSG